MAQGTPVSGNAQKVNQLKEAIQNIQDAFFTQINDKFAVMARDGREIRLELEFNLQSLVHSLCAKDFLGSYCY